MQLEGMAKLLITVGVLIILAGGLVLLMSKVGGPEFKIPGDIYVRRENFVFYFPFATFLILSVLLTFILNFFFRR